jgi:hypothetical protein
MLVCDGPEEERENFPLVRSHMWCIWTNHLYIDCRIHVGLKPVFHLRPVRLTSFKNIRHTRHGVCFAGYSVLPRHHHWRSLTLGFLTCNRDTRGPKWGKTVSVSVCTVKCCISHKFLNMFKDGHYRPVFEEETLFLIVDNARARGEDVKRCRCG